MKALISLNLYLTIQIAFVNHTNFLLVSALFMCSIRWFRFQHLQFSSVIYRHFGMLSNFCSVAYVSLVIFALIKIELLCGDLFALKRVYY